MRRKIERERALQSARADASRLLAASASASDGLRDPFEALARVAAEAVAFKDSLAARVNALQDIRYSASGAGTEQLRAEITLYASSLDRVAKIADTMIRLDFEGKRVELEQAKAARVVAAVRDALEAVDLAPADRQRFLDRFLAGIGRPVERAAGAGETVAGEVE